MRSPLVRLDDEVVEEIAAIARYIGRDNLDAALHFYDQVESDFALLAAMPGIGSLRDPSGGKIPELRSWTVSAFRNYIIFYLPHVRGGIRVLHVVHGARNLDDLF